MREIRLPLTGAPLEDCPLEKLEKIEIELTEEDYDYYNQHGWKRYRPEYYVQYLLPTLGDPIYFYNTWEPVVEIKGKRYKISVESYDYDEPWSGDGRTLVLKETDEPLSKGYPQRDKYSRGVCHVFGQPRWVQGPHFVAYKGKPLCNLITIENGWGDAGNWNILIALEDDIPVAAYFEASCC